MHRYKRLCTATYRQPMPTLLLGPSPVSSRLASLAHPYARPHDIAHTPPSPLRSAGRLAGVLLVVCHAGWLGILLLRMIGR